MTKKEAAQILAILKAAYPNSYKNMSMEDANGTVTVWHIQFSNVPANVVYIAINKWISKNPFPPSICEARKEIEGLYYEIYGILKVNQTYKSLTDEQVAEYEAILKVVERLHRNTSSEISLFELSESGRGLFLTDGKG